MEEPQEPRIPTRRHATQRTAARSGPPLPLIAGISGASLLLFILIFAFSGSPAPRGPALKTPAVRKKAPRILPDVTALESEGRQKCAEGMKLVQPRLNPDAAAPKEAVRADLEKGYRLLNAGLEALQKASALAGKTYETADFARARNRALNVLCRDLEGDGQSLCDQGLLTIKSTESSMTSSRVLTDGEKEKLRTDLERGKKLIEEGMALLERSNLISGHTFNTKPYGQARKAASMKLLELK